MPAFKITIQETAATRTTYQVEAGNAQEARENVFTTGKLLSYHPLPPTCTIVAVEATA